MGTTDQFFMARYCGNDANGFVGPDVNVTVLTTYTPDDNVATLTALNPATGNQTTTNIYGVALANSAIARNDLLAAVLYPDAADSTDCLQLQYNLQSEVAQMQDQNGTVHQYFRDLLGRVTSDQVPTLGTNVNGAVQRIDTAYEIRGMVSQVTSYSLPVSGTFVNQVTLTYNGFEQVHTEVQQPNSSSPTYTVEYAYASGSANTIAPTEIIYPYAGTGSSRVVVFDYSSVTDDASLNRVTTLSFASGSGSSTTVVAAYIYFGLGSFASVTYSQTGVSSTLASGTSYPGFDIFDRVINLSWVNSSSALLAGLGYGYNLASSRTYRADLMAETTSSTLPFDELYGYDGLQRLLDFNRGTLTAGSAPVGNPGVQQIWELDATGNWQNFKQFDLSGTSTALSAVDQQRTSNTANEITLMAATVGLPWAAPGYDRNGNMTSIPEPAAPTSSYSGAVDAWNRLVALTGTAGYGYDGFHRRTYSLVSGSYRYFVYSNQWQVLEEYVSTVSVSIPDRQYVWGIHYIDDLVLRDRTTTGTLSERFYALQDANWNVVAICNTSGTVEERYAYTAYGICQFLNASFDSLTGSAYDWTVLYTGRVRDDESGLYYYRWRYYHAAVGSFLSKDPIGYGNGINLYWYVQGRPASATDPDGRAADCGDDLGGATDAYCKAAGEDPNPQGMALANRCLCEVTKMIGTVVSKGALGQWIGLYNTKCEPWLKCMGSCIFSYWSSWQATLGGAAWSHVSLPVTIPPTPRGLTPAGNPQPGPCWSGKLTLGPFTDPTTPSAKYEGTIGELCKDPKSIGCCHAISTCEKHALVACVSQCKDKQVIRRVIPGWAPCPSVPMVPPEEDADCLKIISQLPPLRGIDYHYDGTLAEQITDSKKVCCDKPFWK